MLRLLTLAGLQASLACSSAPAPVKEQPKAVVGSIVQLAAGEAQAALQLPSPSACSSALGPADLEPMAAVVDSIGQVPASEIQAILQRFPRLRSQYHGIMVNSTPGSVSRLGRVAAAELKQAFHGVRFYRGVRARIPPDVHGIETPPMPYLLAITRDSFYDMPHEFNLLLFATHRRLNDSNVVAMAKAFVLLYAVSDAAHDTASSSGMPPITILDAQRTHTIDALNPDSSGVCVKFKVGREVRELCVGDWRGQFRSVVERNLHLEEDRKKPPGLCGTIEVLGYFLDSPVPALEESVH